MAAPRYNRSLRREPLRRGLGLACVVLFLGHIGLGVRVIELQRRLLALASGDDLMTQAELDHVLRDSGSSLHFYNAFVLATALCFVPYFAMTYRRFSTRRPFTWALWSWLMPIANLYLPYRLAQDVEVAQRRKAHNWTLFTWWIAWIGSWGATIVASLEAPRGADALVRAARWDSLWAVLTIIAALFASIVAYRWRVS